MACFAHGISMVPEPSASTGGAEPPVVDDFRIQQLALQVAAHATLAHAVDVLAVRLAAVLNVPLALLSRDDLSWRLERHAFPDSADQNPVLALEREGEVSDPAGRLQEVSGHAWTAIGLGRIEDRDWALLVPGHSITWMERPHFELLFDRIGWSLGQVAGRERLQYDRRFQRRLYAFTQRLARLEDTAQIQALILRTLAAHVSAGTGAIATYCPADRALAITATVGYPLSLVEHLRIQSGEGLIGRAYASGKPALGDSALDGQGRLRYRTDSYMLLPVRAGNDTLAVVALTDRKDNRPFDARDFSTARALASVAAPALSREQLRARLVELTEVVTVDPLTGLFNRRYFETRLDVEVKRARRQEHDLALLLIDIDDFKRVNDTRGHLEGDRTLREVADVLHAGVRIFDVCARFGGEEFVIVMPGASIVVAQQIAERIRSRIERSFKNDSAPVTVSIGVGMLTEGTTSDQLVDHADRALIAAKTAGKNVVWIGTNGAARRALR
jgi:diguanylate cyclase (GGDEF)-like protein